jgi:hypothetical protein
VQPKLDGTDTRDAANLALAADPDRRLPGEPAETAEWQDALHWLGVYEELVSFTLRHVELAQERLGSLPSPNDGPALLLIQAHSGRLRLRLDYWKRRCAELAPGGAPRNPAI